MLTTTTPTRTIVKRCAICDRAYDREEFVSLELPASGRGVSGGLAWRQCSTPGCHNTLAVPMVDIAHRR